MSHSSLSIQLSGASGKLSNYCRALQNSGALPVPGYAPAPDLNCAGLVLCGGGDLDPALFGQENLGSQPPDPVLDQGELALFHAFYQAGKPILGICRGCQVLNVALGGTLYQDIALFSGVAGKSKASIRHDQPEDRHSVTHKVALISTDLQQMFGETLLVNSHHHQAIEQTARPLRVAARSEDLLIEAVSARESSRFCLGVQWHPECLPAHLPLFNALVEAAATQV